MKQIDEHLYEAYANGENWSYEIFTLEKQSVFKSCYEFESRGESELAALGHIALLTANKQGA